MSANTTITLTEKQAAIVRSRRVPMIYSPGGLGPDMPEAGQLAIRFGGACFVDVEAKLVECLAQFWAALAAVEAQDAETHPDFVAGFQAYPAGQVADAMRGTKSFPSLTRRCPFRRPERVALWQRGYSVAHDRTMAA